MLLRSLGSYWGWTAKVAVRSDYTQIPVSRGRWEPKWVAFLDPDDLTTDHADHARAVEVFVVAGPSDQNG